jgi:hypothetical protein
MTDRQTSRIAALEADNKRLREALEGAKDFLLTLIDQEITPNVYRGDFNRAWDSVVAALNAPDDKDGKAG